MPLSSGVRLGPYEVGALIGSGGMGEVYRARDSKLNRDVALKVLPDLFEDDVQRLARLQREAQVLASINHPNIAAIYGLEEADGVRALVLELVEGPTLAQQIAEGPVPVDEALHIARQIADALEAAHEQGIVHRDLKPANIKVRVDDTVKVLDFGLAKALESETLSADASQSPTLSAAATRAGVILGTAAYMSPEQARGKPIDKRTDIWAFGCVLFEILAGKRVFEAKEVSDIMALVLTKEPVWEVLPPETPEAVRRLLRRCLDKDAKRRLRDIGEARILLGDVEAGAAVSDPPRAAPARLGWIVAAASTVVALALGVANLGQEPTKEAIRFRVLTPEGTTIAPGPAARQLALSPDGQHLAFAARDASGTPHLWLRDLDSLEARLLPGTEGAWFPFWSPDGGFIGFQTPGHIKRIAVSGGPPETLCDLRGRDGAAWSPTGVIVFSEAGEGLYQVPASGGIPAPLTTLEPSRKETVHEWPGFLPDARHFLYFADSLEDEHRGIYVGSLDGGEPRLVLNTDVQATYAEPGYLLFLRGATLMAQPFDASSLKLTGEPSRIAEDVTHNPRTNRTSFSVSETGVLAFRTGGLGGTPMSQLVWFDREGQQLETVGQPGSYYSLRLSPDERRIVVSRPDEQTGTHDLWLHNLARGTEARLTFDPSDDDHPVWSPDGTRIAFSSNRGGIFDLYQKAASGAGEARVLLQSGLNKEPSDWSPDGQSLLFTDNGGYTLANTDLSVLSFTGDDGATSLLATEANELHGRLSPDGRWVAYVSDEGGRAQVYVQPFPGLEGRWLISTDGGWAPRWRGDGRELFYLDPGNNLVAVSVAGGESFEVGSARVLIQAPVRSFGIYWLTQYAVTGDGQRSCSKCSWRRPAQTTSPWW